MTLKIGQIGNLILWSTMPLVCPICGYRIPPGEVHRHDGPIEVGSKRSDSVVQELGVLPDAPSGEPNP